MMTEQKSRHVFAPKLLPTLIMLIMLAILIGLGTWQVRRFGETSARVEQYHQQHDVREAVTSLAAGPDADQRLQDLHFRRANLRGRLDLQHVQLLTARYKFGQRGWGVLVPLEVPTGPHARLLVNLGWVPTGKLNDWLEALRRDPPDLVQGRLRSVQDVPAGQQPVSTQDGMPVWRSADPRASAAMVPDLDPDLLLDAGEQAMGNPVNPEKWPLDGYEYPVHPLPTKHIEYASTWYLLGVTLVAVWVALSRRKAEEPAVPPASGAA